MLNAVIYVLQKIDTVDNHISPKSSPSQIIPDTELVLLLCCPPYGEHVDGKLGVAEQTLALRAILDIMTTAASPTVPRV